jgi:hypothetical protein
VTERAADAQLAVIGALTRVLAAARVRFWLRGGWAVDFLVGAVTRAHADVDAVTWLRHRRRLHRALVDAGFRVARELDVQSDFAKGGVDVSFVFLTRERDGRIATHGIPAWRWRDDALPRGPRRLHGVACRVVGAAQLLEEKEGDPRPARPKDVASIAALRRIVERARAELDAGGRPAVSRGGSRGAPGRRR